MGFPDSSAGKESAFNEGDSSLIPGWGRSPEEGISYPLQYSWASPVAQMVKNQPAIQERPGFDPWVGKLPWRKARQPTLVFLPGESPRTEEPGRLQSMGSQRVGHDWVTKHTYAQEHTYLQDTIIAYNIFLLWSDPVTHLFQYLWCVKVFVFGLECEFWK